MRSSKWRSGPIPFQFAVTAALLVYGALPLAFALAFLIEAASAPFEFNRRQGPEIGYYLLLVTPMLPGLLLAWITERDRRNGRFEREGPIVLAVLFIGSGALYFVEICNAIILTYVVPRFSNSLMVVGIPGIADVSNIARICVLLAIGIGFAIYRRADTT